MLSKMGQTGEHVDTPPKPAAFGRFSFTRFGGIPFCARVRFPKRQTSCRKVIKEFEND